MRVYQQRDVLELLKRKQGKRSQRQFARDLGVSNEAIRQVMCGKRLPSDRITACIGLVKRGRGAASIWVKTPQNLED